jgi:hypothetical protein
MFKSAITVSVIGSVTNSSTPLAEMPRKQIELTNFPPVFLHLGNTSFSKHLKRPGIDRSKSKMTQFSSIAINDRPVSPERRNRNGDWRFNVRFIWMNFLRARL